MCRPNWDSSPAWLRSFLHWCDVFFQSSHIWFFMIESCQIALKLTCKKTRHNANTFPGVVPRRPDLLLLLQIGSADLMKRPNAYINLFFKIELLSLRLHLHDRQSIRTITKLDVWDKTDCASSRWPAFRTTVCALYTHAQATFLNSLLYVCSASFHAICELNDQ